MVPRFARMIGLTLGLGLAFVPTAHASPRISIHVGIGAPAPPIVAPAAVVPFGPPYAGYVWQPGYYAWTRFGYQWVPGAWVSPGYARRGWAVGRWEHGRRDWDDRRWSRDRGREHRDWDRDDRGHGRR